MEGQPHVVAQVKALVSEFPGTAVGLNEFAGLIGLSPEGAAQLRAARKATSSLPRASHAPFPDVVAESGRSFAHRLEDLVRWIDDVHWLDSGRGGRNVDPDRAARAVQEWRLSQYLQAEVERQGTQPSRVAVARYVTDDIGVLPDRLVAAVDAAREFPGVLDRVITELGRGQPGVPRRTASDVAFLTALALDANDDMSVHDATCGECEVLLWVARLARSRGDALGRITGDDEDADAMAIGAARLALAGVAAELGSTPSAGTVDRLVIDPGWDTPLTSLTKWIRPLKQDGRVALIARIAGDESELVADLPPSLIVLPPQPPARLHGAGAIWISTPKQDPPEYCRVVDLRRESTQKAPIEDHKAIRVWLGLLSSGLCVRQPDWPAGDPGWDIPLKSTARAPIPVKSIANADLLRRLPGVITGGLRHAPEVVEKNRVYAAALAEELRRLIDVDKSAIAVPSADLIRPELSPNGVLAGVTTAEAKRVVDRIAKTLKSGTPRGRRSR